MSKRKSPLVPLVLLFSLIAGTVVVFAVVFALIKAKKEDPKAVRNQPANTRPAPERKLAPRAEPTDERPAEEYAPEFNPLWVVYVLILTPIYFAPTIIALLRRHNNAAPIIIVNFLLGCFFVGWVVSLAWSLSDLTPHRHGPT